MKNKKTLEDEFGSYEQAVALKELGFDEECLDYYYKVYKKDIIELWKFSKTQWPDTSHPIVWAPLKQQIFKFFRDKYNLEGVTQRHDDGTAFKFWIHKYHENNKSIEYGGYDYPSHEEAENACIDKLIELVKQQEDEKHTCIAHGKTK
jgi:hypothetical protein